MNTTFLDTLVDIENKRMELEEMERVIVQLSSYVTQNCLTGLGWYLNQAHEYDINAMIRFKRTQFSKIEEMNKLIDNFNKRIDEIIKKLNQF